jgi:hypothetical protein
MVDLDDPKGSLRFQGAADRIEPVPRLLGPVAPLDLFALADPRQASIDRLARRLGQAFLCAAGLDALYQQRFPRLQKVQVARPDLVLDDRLDPAVQPTDTRWRAG